MAYIVSKTIDHQRVYDFINLRKEVTERLKSRRINKIDVYGTIGMAEATFYRKLKLNSWSPDDLLKLLDYGI